MGRALHFTIKDSKTITDDKWKRIFDISEHYNNNYRWTCESPFINPYGFLAKTELRPIVEKKWKEFQNKNFHPIEILKSIILEGLGEPLKDNNKDYFDSVKVTGNEFNAALLYYFLLDVSMEIPTHIISLHDEGKFLLGPVLIKNGRVKIDKKILRSNKDVISHKFYKKLLSMRNYTSPEKFCRPVKSKDFKDYPEFETIKMDLDTGNMIGGTPCQIMAGFDGEYYGLNQKDPELNSYETIAFIQKSINRTRKERNI